MLKLCSWWKLMGEAYVTQAIAVAVHESQRTGMRLWNRTRDGMNRDRGVGTADEESWIGREDIDTGDASDEFELSEDFLRLTGPGPDEENSGKRERSAMSQELTISGATSRLDIHGSPSNTWGEGVIRRLTRDETRRRRGELAFGRLLRAYRAEVCEYRCRL